MIPSQILIICCRNFNKICEKPNVVKKYSEEYSIIFGFGRLIYCSISSIPYLPYTMIPISSLLRIAMKRILAHQGNQKTERKDIDRIRHDITKDTKRERRIVNVFYNKLCRSFSSILENSINNNVDPTPIVAKSIEKDIDVARTRLNSHVTTKEEILTLDKNCEYCQIYLKE
jgi:hypothetical protein